MIQDEKDQMKEDAYALYCQTYGTPRRGSNEQYLVSKGIEAMAAKAFAKLEELERAAVDAYRVGRYNGSRA